MLWAQSTTKDYIKAEHKLHSISKLCISQVSYHKSWFLSLFIFRRHLAQEPPSSKVTYFILRAYTGTGVSHSQHGKKLGEVWKKCRWMDRKVEIRKKSLAVSVACIGICWSTPGLKLVKWRMFKLCVLIGWDFKFLSPQLPTVGTHKNCHYNL